MLLTPQSRCCNDSLLFIPQNTHPKLAESSLPWKAMTHPCAHFHYRHQLIYSCVHLHRTLIIKIWENCTFPMSRERGFILFQHQVNFSPIDFTLNINSGQHTQCWVHAKHFLNLPGKHQPPFVGCQRLSTVRAGECEHTLDRLKTREFPMPDRNVNSYENKIKYCL